MFLDGKSSVTHSVTHLHSQTSTDKILIYIFTFFHYNDPPADKNISFYKYIYSTCLYIFQLALPNLQNHKFDITKVLKLKIFLRPTD